MVNGYTNHETYLTALHITNWKKLNKLFEDKAKMILKSYDNDTFEARYELSEFIKDSLQNLIDLRYYDSHSNNLSNYINDMINYNIAENINFIELAEIYLE